MSAICIRSTLTMLHGLMGLAAGFFCLYTFLSSSSPPQWLPQLVGSSGVLIPFRNGLPIVCNSLVYGMGAVCLLNFVMCIVNNCLFKSICVIIYHLMLTSVFLAFSVMGGATVTVYYIVWCDVLQEAVSGSTGCDDAAVKYDVFNSTAKMSSYKSQMEIQMASIWLMFPLTCFALLTYSLTLPFMVTLQDTENRVRYILIQDETTPLLASANRHVNMVTDTRTDNNQPSTSTVSDNQ